MNNELKINRLLEYEVKYMVKGENLTDIFTADDYIYDQSTARYLFKRTGNILREYPAHTVYRIVAKPADEV